MRVPSLDLGFEFNDSTNPSLTPGLGMVSLTIDGDSQQLIHILDSKKSRLWKCLSLRTEDIHRKVDRFKICNFFLFIYQKM